MVLRVWRGSDFLRGKLVIVIENGGGGGYRRFFSRVWRRGRVEMGYLVLLVKFF